MGHGRDGSMEAVFICLLRPSTNTGELHGLSIHLNDLASVVGHSDDLTSLATVYAEAYIGSKVGMGHPSSGKLSIRQIIELHHSWALKTL